MKHIRKVLMGILLISFHYNSLEAQDDINYKGKFFIAPDFGLIIGNSTQIEVSPVLGYYFTDRFSVAAGFKYEYYKLTRYYSDNFETNIFGPRLYVRYSVIKNLGDILPVQSNIEILAHAEFESLSLERKYFMNPTLDGRFWYNTVLIGGGISQIASPRIKFNAIILWDVDTSTLSPFTNPIFRIGIQIMLGRIDYLENYPEN